MSFNMNIDFFRQELQQKELSFIASKWLTERVPFIFVVRILPDIDDIEIRTIFQRLNKNTVALNKQELRQATYWGPFITLMNKISDKEYWSEFNIFSPNDIRRMLDVEFISEIAVAALHGPQNKKQNLDKFYKIYEDDFEQENELEYSFDTVASELLKVFPDIGKTRWRKKTDFYTLFLTMFEHRAQLPLAKDIRDKGNKILVGFGEKIDQFVKAEQKDQTRFPINVRDYASGIRASTDLGSRKRRQSALEKEMHSVSD
jgi:hypothetical protein